MVQIHSVIVFLLITFASSKIFVSSESEIGIPIELLQDDIDDEYRKPVELISSKADDQILQCNNFWGVRCASCTHLQVCLGNNQVDIKSCSDINQNTPFCNDRSCTSTLPNGCKDEIPSSSFTCTSVGLFPNTNNCSRFFLCSKIGEGPREFECPSPFIYSSRDGACKRRNTQNDCQIINCSQQAGKFIIYNPDKSILAYCKRDSTFPILTRCPDNINQEYDPQTLQCKFICRTEGRFPDNLDCKKYYECLRNGVSFIKIHRNCDPLIYDRVSGQCRYSVNGCENQIITTTAHPVNSGENSSSSPTTSTTSNNSPPSSSTSDSSSTTPSK